MPTLHITRGLPASGKTTWATDWVAQDPQGRARINRDDLRQMVNGGVHVAGVTEPRIIALRDESIRALLRAGLDVVCDDTNLPQRTVRDLMKLARRAGADVEVHDEFAAVPVETCIDRDSFRDRPVGDEVIRDMWTRYLKGRTLTTPEAAEVLVPGLEPYEPKPGTPRTVLVDIDGTLALHNGRDPYDETRVGEDLPNRSVVEVVRALWRDGYHIVFVSGRSEGCRDATLAWLYKYLPVIALHVEGHQRPQGRMVKSALHMRAVGDVRRDSVVKAELFDQHIREHYDVIAVLDDRRQVVEMWRALGLAVFQVADGDF